MNLTARQLRLAGRLWPQCLTDDELRLALANVDSQREPISYEMLHDESTRRREGKPIE